MLPKNQAKLAPGLSAATGTGTDDNNSDRIIDLARQSHRRRRCANGGSRGCKLSIKNPKRENAHAKAYRG